ncbi:hypothetical protein C5167_010241 [Papaver somniferum]|uniref:Small ribosomal subunit protein bS18c n=1 Tax=Papaver somniferum TaxID=3469 RepID=A0A4Y7K2R2_PAPSO|nr:hypothetical protein C5167_010241 [Papaver somniferum]
MMLELLLGFQDTPVLVVLDFSVLRIEFASVCSWQYNNNKGSQAIPLLSRSCQQMNLIRVGARSVNGGLSGQCRQPWMIRNISSAGHSELGSPSNRLMILSGGFLKLDKLGPRGRSGFGARSNYQSVDSLDENFNSLSDGMDGKLKKAANYFGFNYDELETEDYAYRPDVNFRPGTTQLFDPPFICLELEKESCKCHDEVVLIIVVVDLDIRRAGVWKPFQREEFTTTTEDVLKYADFRNLRFLANFITEAGIIEKRSKFKISAKAQRKIAREIKISRALGLMPFTTMGQDPFIPGKSRLENEDEEYDFYARPSIRERFTVSL